jgi:hypothetical protein
MLMDLTTTKTESAQAAYEDVAATSPRFRELMAAAVDRVRFYDAHLEHVRRCAKAVGCEACIMPRNAGFRALLLQIRGEVQVYGDQVRADLAPWLEQLGHVDHVADKFGLASRHVSRLTEKFHAAVELLEDDRLAVANMAIDFEQESHLRTAYEMCDQITRDVLSTEKGFARAGAQHMQSVIASTQNLTPRLLAGSSEHAHCDAVHMMMRTMVAERFQRLALELDSYTGETMRATMVRRAEILDRMFLTLSL